jgi:hypothetical protein
MSRPFKPLHADSDQARDRHLGDVVYLVKRPGYEFVLTVLKAGSQCLKGERVFFQGLFRDQHGGQGVTLDLEELTDFYESLGKLMEYVRIEREKS